MTPTICKNDLVNMGYPEHTAKNLICQAKKIMIQKGYAFYNNRRLGRVPSEVVESIIGVKLSSEESEVADNE